MNLRKKLSCGVSALLFSGAAVSGVLGAAFPLSSGSGDGSVQVGVNGFGAFGSSGSANTSNAIYDPVGPIAAAGTVYNSAVAIRFGSTGTRTYLTDGTTDGEPGNLTNPTVSGSTTSGTSAFTYNGLSFQLTQNLGLTTTSGATSGSKLTQTYQITNTTGAAVSFEMVRYLDGDLLFDGSLIDGGGKLGTGSSTTLFETDSATGANDSTTFVGIDASGGTVPSTGYYQLLTYPTLGQNIAAGDTLADTIEGDLNGDGFIDTGSGYDVTLALLNEFTLDPSQSVNYTTDTLFGTGTPASVAPSTPEPVASAMIVLGCGLLAGRKFSRGRSARPETAVV